MKTNIFISSLTALFLVIALADSPGSHALNTFTSRHDPLPLQNSPQSTKTASINDLNRISTVKSSLVLPSDDFSYLKFNVADFMENDSSSEPGELPESPCPDYSYLKFDVNRFIAPGEDQAVPVGELPIPETEPSLILQ